ncbi:MAG: dihydroneopterin triphosphate diphosphatase [Laribacter sp.]|nr:dihydroneopterin triphosphate diphosphatase [Laribacter sp.]MBP9528276.1 dihydroneopterin triphosphate diphosphatase [Laribacter sp.]MBP9609994.1 dihydroneopterin triphosphate diphosphatase [Laribacter sp.]
MTYKRPESVLVVIHTIDLQILLLERADAPGFWQSVTGSLEEGESLPEAAWREVAEETGLTAGRMHDWQQQNVWEIYPRWRHRYAPGITHNTEHVFSLEVPAGLSVRLAPGEHTAACWLPWQAAAAQAFSPSNAEAIRALARQQAGTSAD